MRSAHGIDALPWRLAYYTGRQRAGVSGIVTMPLKHHAVIDGADATVKIDTTFQPHELVVEDELDSAAIQLTPAIARAMIAKLQGWLEVHP